MGADTKVAIFKGKEIRKIIHKDEWWFSVIDVVEALTESSIPKRYWADLKAKLIKEGFSEAYEKIVRLKMKAPDGKNRGGKIAGNARKELEKELGRSVVSKNNFKKLSQKKKLK